MHLKPVCRQKVNKGSVGLLYTAAILAVSIAPSREGGEDGSDITGSISGSLVREGEGVFSDSQATFVSDLLATFWDMQGSMESKCLGV